MPIDAKLIFIRPADGTGRLVFGDDTDVAIQPTAISVDATFAGDSDCSVQLLWDANVSRGEAIETRVHWQTGQPAAHSVSAAWQLATPIAVRSAAHWQDGAPVAGLTAERWQDSAQFRARAALVWQEAAPQRGASRVHWQEAEHLRASTAPRWQEGTAQRHVVHAPYQEALHLRSTAHMFWQGATPSRTLLRHNSAAGIPVHLRAAVRWQDARKPPAGVSVIAVPVDPPLEPCYDPLTLGRLEFTEPWANSGRLVFVCRDTTQPGAGIVIPALRTYIVINNATLHRVSDNAVVPCFSLTLSLDRDSWSWGFGASVPASAAGMLLDEPDVELRTVVNGTEFRLVVEDAERDRAFGQMGLRVSGNGRNTFLDETPMLFGNTVARTAQQLMLDVLTENGVSIGWNVDWQLTDWLVPAGVFNHSGTYRSALATIAAAAGGFIRPHPSLQTLSVLHRYPVAPWDWATAVPAIELPAAVATREGTRWVNKPEYNRVFVMGEGAGINGRVTRAGTAGDKPAQMVVDPLITATAAARQRGIAILGDTGRQRMLSLRLPVLPETGIILPGTLLRYMDQDAPRMGVVHGVNVDVQMPAIYQTLEVESHE